MAYTVLVPVDTDTTRARGQVDYVETLVDNGTDVDVVVLHVFPEVQPAESAKIDLRGYAETPDSVAYAVDALESIGVDVEERAESGEPEDGILAVADDVDADDIAVGGRQRSPAGKLLFGSVAQSVILKSTRPVTSTKPKSDAESESE
ncbi:universal stress protein [Halocalculus aciditolerans]|uniref:UspA domain-containing protein n=1 Tax=Halocalculus aciditolerans TaxID=1383812 RepID=A0A830F527_9EURY|nr:universal stress protein [Halocalculus aciditolerans]GGL63779.1 hypothetical protein GCM10009039_22090 [Halocalculus aciditolerans]